MSVVYGAFHIFVYISSTYEVGICLCVSVNRVCVPCGCLSSEMLFANDRVYMGLAVLGMDERRAAICM